MKESPEQRARRRIAAAGECIPTESDARDASAVPRTYHSKWLFIFFL